MKISGSRVNVYFTSASLGGGLVTRDTLAPKQFFVAGDDHVFHQATAAIVGDHITLNCDSVANPVAVRFAFTNMAVINLFNKAGLPAEPFRTDNWSEEDKGPKIKLDYKKLNEGK